MIAKNFQEFIFSLCQYWVNYGCIWSQSYDSQMGAGTFHPHTFLKAIGPEPWRSVYVQPCRRPVDGRYGKSPYRFQHYYQLQVLLKPSPANILDVFLNSLQHVGIDLKENDIGLLEDDWKGPTLGAWGLGWEVRANGQEVTQFTYFQQIGGLDCETICGEITYGLERLFMYAHGYKNALEMPFNDHFTYGDIFYQNEFEFSHFNFKEADVKSLFEHFGFCEKKVSELCDKQLVLPAYDYVLKASHLFNLLDSRGAISVSERQRYIGKVRDSAKKCALGYRKIREDLGFPLLNVLENDARKNIVPKSASAEVLILTDREKNSVDLYDSKKHFSDKNYVNFVVELGVEEMPPSFQTSTYLELNNRVQEFKDKYLDIYSSNKVFLDLLFNTRFNINISSRRISVVAFDFPKNEAKRELEIWGPAEKIARNQDGSLSQAGLGFCRKNNIDSNEISFKQKENEASLFMYTKKTMGGDDFPSVFIKEFQMWIKNLNIPLKMKWLPETIADPFIRPVRWILCLIEDKVFPLQMFGLNAGNKTKGQRILSPNWIIIEHANSYLEKLANNHVILEREIRKKTIIDQGTQLALKNDGQVLFDQDLLDKCVGLSESPYVFCGAFDEKYLRLPEKLITSVLKEHMNYFSVFSRQTRKLLPYYIGVANYRCNNLENMVSETLNVVVGRLEDGAFYFDSDLTKSFKTLREGLKDQVFQENMGSLFDKTIRLKDFVQSIMIKVNLKSKNYFSDLDKVILIAAAENCKNDLKTGCVQEFPDEMQGVMGGVLVRHQSYFEKPEQTELMAKTIEEHYLPLGGSSSLPKNKLALVLSLADKFDSLCLMLNNGVEVKGNKDIFGLRRLAISIGRILGARSESSEIILPISFKELYESWSESCLMINQNSVNVKKEVVVFDFVLERFKALFKEEFDVRSVDAVTKIVLNIPLSSCRKFIDAVNKNFSSETNDSLLKALIPYKRARSLTLSIAEKNINTALFTSKAESDLYQKVLQVEQIAFDYFYKDKFDLFLKELSSLSGPLSNFFDSVMVNDKVEEIKQNRLQLLLKIRMIYEKVADFSSIQVG